MKQKILQISTALLMLIPVICCGQHTIHSGKEEFNHPFFVDEDFTIHATANFKFYYDENDNKIKHGLCSISGNESWGMHDELKCQTSITANFKEGHLDGTLSGNEKVSGGGANASWSVKVNYTDGIPNGLWTVTMTGTAKGATEIKTASMTWADGKVISFKSEEGYSVSLDDNNFIKSGNFDNLSIKSGIVLNRFIRKNGELSDVEQEQKSIIDKYISGGITDSDLLDLGYTLQEESSRLFSWFNGLLDREYVNIYWFDPNYVRRASPKYKVLCKVPMCTYEELVALYEEDVKNTSNDQYYKPKINIDEIEKNRYVSIDYKKVYISTNTFEQFKAYCDKQIKEKEEKRIAEENKRIAEQNRVKEVKSVMTDLELSLSSIYAKCTETKKGYSGIFITTKDKIKVKKGYEQVYEQFSNVVSPYLTTLNSKKAKDCTDEDLSNAQQIIKFANSFYENVVDGTMIKKIQNNYSQIEQACGKEYADVFKAYGTIYKAYNLAPSFSTFEEYDTYLSKLNGIMVEQNNCLRFIQLRTQATQNATKIVEASGKEYADVSKAYTDFDKTYDVSFVQDTASNWGKMEKLFSIQNNCMNFIELRKQISNLNNDILAQGKNCKNIVKVYSTYFKGIDLSWTSDENAAQKLQTIISNQEVFKKAMTGGNAKDLDNQVKKMKDKSLNAVLDVIK